MHLFVYILFLAILNTSYIQGNIPTLFNTGVNNAGVSLPLNSLDPHWTYDPPGATGPTPARTIFNGGYLAPTAVSNWISIGQGRQPSGQYFYTTTFDLTGFIVNQVSFDYRIAVDDRVSSNPGSGVFLNGNLIPGPSYSGFSSWSPTFTIVSNNDSGQNWFVDNINTLTFSVDNFGGPTGFRFEQLSGVTPVVPEPSTYLILLSVLSTTLLLKFFRDKKKKVKIK